MPDDVVAQVREKLTQLDQFQDAVRKDLLGLRDDFGKLRQQTLGGPPGGLLRGQGDTETRGQLFLKSDQFKLFKATNQRRSGQVVIETRAILSPPVPVPPARVDAVSNTYAPLTLRSLLNPIPVKGGSVEYLRQKATTGTAAVQYPQGALKAEATLDFELAVANVVTVAVWTQASRQVLDDEPQLQSIIDGELSYQVDLAEELEILNGDGTAGHMHGLMVLAPVFTPTAGTSAIDIVGKAIGQLGAAGYRVSGVVLNPADWTAMMQVKAAPGGLYLVGNPGQGATAPYLWNVPVVLSANVTAGEFLTGAFGTAAQLYDREVRLEVSTEDRDNFVKNLVTVLCERRSALAVRRPAGFLQGSLTAA